MPHELGHQLGFIDFYGLDYAGDENHLWPDNKEKVYHLNYHPITMMAWHGPHLYNEVDMNYLNVSLEQASRAFWRLLLLYARRDFPERA